MAMVEQRNFILISEIVWTSLDLDYPPPEILLRKYMSIKSEWLYLPDGDVCEFCRSDGDACGSRTEIDPFPEPSCFSHSYSVYEHLKWVWKAIISNDMSFVMCSLRACAVSAWRIKAQ